MILSLDGEEREGVAPTLWFNEGCSNNSGCQWDGSGNVEHVRVAEMACEMDPLVVDGDPMIDNTSVVGRLFAGNDGCYRELVGRDRRETREFDLQKED